MYSNDNRPPNSNECLYNGRKLSNVVAEVKCSDYIDQVCIGADDDDEFDSRGISEKQGRIKIGLEINRCSCNDDYNCWPEIDLEDILVFARKYCNGIYERIYKDIKTDDIKPEHFDKLLSKEELEDAGYI